MRRNISICKKGWKRVTAAGLCTVLLFGGFAKTVKGAAVFYAIVEEQEMSQWCWVASARGVARGETTVTKTQADGVRAIKGNVIDEGGTDDETLRATKYFSPNSDFIMYGPLSFNQIQACINNGHLILTLYDPLIDVHLNGHAMFVTGYNTNNGRQDVWYCEPFEGFTGWYPFDCFNRMETGGGIVLEYTNSIFCRMK